jgi:hypothetical protein
MQATVTTPNGEQLKLAGFMAVSREKLRGLSGETLEKLAKNDELELLYLHLSSMRNFNEVKERLIGALRAEAESDAEEPGSKTETAKPPRP